MIVQLENPKKRKPLKKTSAATAQPKSVESILPSVEKPKKAAKEHIVVDHPANGSRIEPHHYAVRIGAGGGTDIQISIDNGEWKPCRPSAGYFWYDWSQIASGPHRLVARMKLPTGKYKKSKIVRCSV